MKRNADGSYTKPGVLFKRIVYTQLSLVQPTSYADYLWGKRSTEIFPLTIDPGFIRTTPSDYGGYNDCTQYRVSGVINLYVGIKQGMTLQGTAITNPVFLDQSGVQKTSYSGRDPFGRPYEWEALHEVSLTHSATKATVKVTVTQRVLIDGDWTIVGPSQWTDVYYRPSSLIPFTAKDDVSIVPDDIIARYAMPTYRIDVLKRQLADFGDLAARAAQSVRLLDINTVMYIRDLKRVGDLIKVGESGFKTLKSALSSLSDFYLSQHYGTRLTVKDTLNVASGLDRLDLDNDTQLMGASDSQTVHYDGIDYHCSRRLTARISNVSKETLDVTDSVARATEQLVDRILRVGYETDLLPTAANIWDMVPYSFVVDWFLPIGESLERHEVRNYIETLPVKICFKSDKIEWFYSGKEIIGSSTLDASLDYKFYNRECTGSLPLPLMHIDTPKGDFSHWLEASALILQRVT